MPGFGLGSVVPPPTPVPLSPLDRETPKLIETMIVSKTLLALIIYLTSLAVLLSLSLVSLHKQNVTRSLPICYLTVRCVAAKGVTAG